MKFIIFDLDDTLLSGDCEREWINFLFLKGLIKDPKSKLDEFDQSYRKGALDFEEYSNFIQSPIIGCLLYTSPSPRDLSTSRMPSSA